MSAKGTPTMNSSTRTALGLWSELGKDAADIRTQVFVKEQGIPAELEWDETDKVCVHVLVYSEAGSTSKAVGTGRLIAPENAKGPAKIGRMAVLKEYRRQGIGDDVMQALIEHAFDAGYTSVELSAQAYVQGFYANHGFEAEGEPYEEVGIPHQKMMLKLS
jgi:predicted GNAT family N-acyltransferase